MKYLIHHLPKNNYSDFVTVEYDSICEAYQEVSSDDIQWLEILLFMFTKDGTKSLTVGKTVYEIKN